PERLVPRDRHEARVLAAPLARVGALHRTQDAVWIVRLLHQAERLDADLAAGRMHARRVEVRIDLGRDAVLDAHLQEIRPRHALVAVGRDGAVAPRCGCHGASVRHPERAAARLAAFAFSRSCVLPTSTTKRVWVLVAIGSSSSLAAISNSTLRPSTPTTLAAISTPLPRRAGPTRRTGTSRPPPTPPA